MKYIAYLISIVLLVGINLGLFTQIPLKGQIPNLLFLFALCASLEKKDFDFFFISFVCGVVLDFYSVGFFGAFTLGLLVVGLCMHFAANNILVLEFNWKSLSGALLSAFLILNLIVWLYGFAAFKLNWAPEPAGFKIFMGDFIWGLLYNWLLLYPTYLFFNFLRRSLDNFSVRSRGVIR
jgi:cell shape-determining protein MreD